MQIEIPSPKHYESYYGSSDLVRAYLNQIEKKVGEELPSDVIDILSISLLIAPPEELAQGKYLAYEKFDWRYGLISIGVNGNFERYHLGDELDKIKELSEMLQVAFLQLGKKRKAKFNYSLANEIVIQVTHTFLHNFAKNSGDKGRFT